MSILAKYLKATYNVNVEIENDLVYADPETLNYVGSYLMEKEGINGGAKTTLRQLTEKMVDLRFIEEALGLHFNVRNVERVIDKVFNNHISMMEAIDEVLYQAQNPTGFLESKGLRFDQINCLKVENLEVLDNEYIKLEIKGGNLIKLPLGDEGCALLITGSEREVKIMLEDLTASLA